MPDRDEVIAEFVHARSPEGWFALEIQERWRLEALADAMLALFAEPSGVAVPDKFVNETDEPADPTQAAIYWQRRLTDAQEAIYQAQGVYEAVRDLLWRVVQYGETDDGDTATYIVSKGTVHRLVGAMGAAGESAPLRNAGVAVPDEQRCPDCIGGSGRTMERFGAGGGWSDVREVDCETCNGTGRVSRPAASPVADEQRCEKVLRESPCPGIAFQGPAENHVHEWGDHLICRGRYLGSET